MIATLSLIALLFAQKCVSFWEDSEAITAGGESDIEGDGLPSNVLPRSPC
jgi:hypothetical protein